MINLKNCSRITRNEKWQLRMHRPRPDFPKSIVHHVFHIKFCCCKVPFRNVRNCYLSFQRDLAHSARETADTPHRHPLLSRPKNHLQRYLNRDCFFCKSRRISNQIFQNTVQHLCVQNHIFFRYVIFPHKLQILFFCQQEKIIFHVRRKL